MPERFDPASDQEFDNWQDVLVAYAVAHAGAFGLSPADLAPVTAAQTQWQADYPAHLAAHHEAKVATIRKKESRAAYLAALRLLIRRLQVNPNVTDTHRIEMRIPVHDRIRTRAKPPETWPVASLQLLGPNRFLMDFRDSESHRRAKPKGVIGCEIWAKVGGDPPTSPTDLRYIGTATRAPHRLELAVGRDPAWLRLAWLNRRGERGPFGPMVEV